MILYSSLKVARESYIQLVVVEYEHIYIRHTRKYYRNLKGGVNVPLTLFRISLQFKNMPRSEISKNFFIDAEIHHYEDNK